MKLHMKLDADLLKRISVGLAILAGLSLAGCSSSTPLDAGTTSSTGTSSVVSTSGTTNATTINGSLPTNIFNAIGTDTTGTIAGVTTSTTGTPITTTGTSATAYPITTLQSNCLTSPTTLFDGITSSGTITPITGTTSTTSTSETCWSNTPISQELVNQFNLNSLNMDDQCLQIAMAMEPPAGASTTEVIDAAVQAQLVILRCVQNEVLQAAAATTWNATQNQVFGATDIQLTNYMQSLAQQYPSVPAYTGSLTNYLSSYNAAAAAANSGISTTYPTYTYNYNTAH